MFSDVLFYALMIGLPSAGFVVRRLEAALLPLVLWPAFFLAQKVELWGDGVGDDWVLTGLALTALGAVSTAAAVVLGQMVSAASGEETPRSRRRTPPSR